MEQAYGLGNQIMDKPESEWNEQERRFMECLERWASMDATHEVVAKNREKATSFRLEIELPTKGRC